MAARPQEIFSDYSQCGVVVALHARLHRPLRRFFTAYRLSAEDAEDLAQEVFLRLTRPGQVDGLRDPEAFAFTLARNLLRDRARRLHTRCSNSSVAIEELNLPCNRPTPDQTFEHYEQLKSADTALASLKPSTRAAFLMHRVDGLGYSDVAARMGVSVSMVEKHIMAAMAALREVNA
jgi:RNA polymerase sigma factor (sigma-70 family)